MLVVIVKCGLQHAPQANMDQYNLVDETHVGELKYDSSNIDVDGLVWTGTRSTSFCHVVVHGAEF